MDDTSNPPPAFLRVEGQSADAGLCVDGVCALPEPVATSAARLTLISVPLCPYVQRAIIALTEKEVEFEVIYVDLADRPAWFREISPLGKVPVLRVERDGHAPVHLFESAVILEYLEETVPGRSLHPADPLERAFHRAWMEFGSQVLADLWRFGSAGSVADLDAARQAVRAKFTRLEVEVTGPWFAGAAFSAVDAVFAPAFRQIDAIDLVNPTSLLDGFPRLVAWSRALASRPSVREAAPEDYGSVYLAYLRGAGSVALDAGNPARG